MYDVLMDLEERRLAEAAKTKPTTPTIDRNYNTWVAWTENLSKEKIREIRIALHHELGLRTVELHKKNVDLHNSVTSKSVQVTFLQEANAALKDQVAKLQNEIQQLNEFVYGQCGCGE